MPRHHDVYAHWFFVIVLIILLVILLVTFSLFGPTIFTFHDGDLNKPYVVNRSIGEQHFA